LVLLFNDSGIVVNDGKFIVIPQAKFKIANRLIGGCFGVGSVAWVEAIAGAEASEGVEGTQNEFSSVVGFRLRG
jgi:hypothetical protein